MLFVFSEPQSECTHGHMAKGRLTVEGMFMCVRQISEGMRRGCVMNVTANGRCVCVCVAVSVLPQWAGI